MNVSEILEAISKIESIVGQVAALKDAIAKEVAKEKDAKKRKKLYDALEKNDYAAIREILYA